MAPRASDGVAVNRECEQHYEWLQGHERRIREIEMNIARSGARVALIAAGAAAVFSTILTVLASLAVFWVTGKP